VDEFGPGFWLDVESVTLYTPGRFEDSIG